MSFVTGIALVCGSVSAYSQHHDTSSREVTETLGCGKYFMDKIQSLRLSFNRSFTTPYFIFKDCDGSEQVVYIACGCGATGYAIEKYGKTYSENERLHPELDKLISILEESVAHKILKKEYENGELVYRRYCL